ncbi:MAG: DUF2306 domain-containing protein [Burkholderiales bacterium]|nr:MAG: DUF2306 domain-containing protein [Burkholderiales bacterium]
MTPLQARLLEPAIAAHVLAAVLALAIGAYVVAGRKGTPAHRLAGRFWVVAMVVTALGSFFIEAQRFPLHTPLGTFGPIHLLSAFTLWNLWRAIAAIRRGAVIAHRRAMVGAFAGLVIAGMFTLVPGRTLGSWLIAIAA